MKVAVIGSRTLQICDLGDYLPKETTALISGGAVGVDACVRDFALEKGIELTEFIPDYRRYGRAAPLKRNDQIIEHADMVIAFWDGKSKGTAYVIEKCRQRGVPVEVHTIYPNNLDLPGIG